MSLNAYFFEVTTYKLLILFDEVNVVTIFRKDLMEYWMIENSMLLLGITHILRNAFLGIFYPIPPQCRHDSIWKTHPHKIVLRSMWTVPTSFYQFLFEQFLEILQLFRCDSISRPDPCKVQVIIVLKLINFEYFLVFQVEGCKELSV